jgi:hypothetical protein
MLLTVGLRIFHNGVPVELLYQIRPGLWRVKMLFVRAEYRNETFGPYDTMTQLHSKAA